MDGMKNPSVAPHDGAAVQRGTKVLGIKIPNLILVQATKVYE
jgi:hypothetical protein